VEKQVAIIYCGAKGLLKDVPVNKVREFEADYLDYLDMKHKDVLKQLKDGQLNDDVTKTLELAAIEIGAKYKKK